MITFRMAAPSDAEELAQLRWDYMQEQGRCGQARQRDFVLACRGFMEEGLASGEWVIWVAEEEGRILSLMCLQRVRKVPRPARLHDEIGYLTNVYTRPDYRGRGIGSAVLARVVQWARAEDLDTVICWAAEGREAFYGRAGFERPREVLECEVRDEGQGD